MKPVGEEEIFRKLSLEDCKLKCDDDPYCNYFSHNISTSICRTMHEMTNSTDQPYIDEEKDAFLLCKKSKKTMKSIKTLICNIIRFSFLFEICFKIELICLINLLECMNNGEWDRDFDKCICAGSYFGNWCEHEHTGISFLQIDLNVFRGTNILWVII